MITLQGRSQLSANELNFVAAEVLVLARKLQEEQKRQRR